MRRHIISDGAARGLQRRQKLAKPNITPIGKHRFRRAEAKLTSPVNHALSHAACRLWYAETWALAEGSPNLASIGKHRFSRAEANWLLKERLRPSLGKVYRPRFGAKALNQGKVLDSRQRPRIKAST